MFSLMSLDKTILQESQVDMSFHTTGVHMNKKALIFAAVAACLTSGAALAQSYDYRDQQRSERYGQHDRDGRDGRDDHRGYDGRNGR
jgi:hypothetical protein